MRIEIISFEFIYLLIFDDKEVVIFYLVIYCC